ncbi:MAG TPA: hypothetical protein DDY78_14800 [Planctomycetales bacterium]|nr:hypothetical protein [Planctomycetales bacterium]
MGDQSGLQTRQTAPFSEARPAEFSQPSLTAARGSHPLDHVPAPLRTTTLDQSGLANRIRDNLNWATTFHRRSSPFRPADVWSEIMTLWPAPDEDFVSGLYELLLDRPPDPVSLETFLAVLAAGAPRAALVRVIALSRDAAVSQLDVSWLPRLETVEPDAVWAKVQSLWGEPDRVFVASLYPLLLVRPPEWEGVTAHCRAMKAGTSRAYVVRAIALSDEALVRGLSVSWLPQLETLPTPPSDPPVMSVHWLRTAFRRWRTTVKSFSSASSRETEGAPQSVGAAAEGGRE